MYQYNLENGLLRNKINFVSLSKDPIDSKVNIALYGIFIQFNWKIEEKNIIWNLHANQSKLVEYIAKLQTSEQSTFVNGSHVKMSPKNMYFDETVFQKLGI